MKKKIYSLGKISILAFALSAGFANAQISQTQSFDSSSSMPAGFVTGGNVRSVLKTDGVHSQSGTNYIQLYSAGTSDPSTLTYTDNASFESGKPVYVGFSYTYANASATVNATALVEYSTDNGVTWTSVGTLNLLANTSTTTAQNYSTSFSANVPAGTPIKIKITFKLKDSAGAYLYIDNMQVNQTGILGIQDLAKTKIKVFPTITTGIVNVTSEEVSKISVYNTNGIIVKSASAKKGTSSIDVSNLTPGMYLVNVGIESFKIIKK